MYTVRRQLSVIGGWREPAEVLLRPFLVVFPVVCESKVDRPKRMFVGTPWSSSPAQVSRGESRGKIGKVLRDSGKSLSFEILPHLVVLLPGDLPGRIAPLEDIERRVMPAAAMTPAERTHD